MRLSPAVYLLFLTIPLFAWCVGRLAARAGYSTPVVLLFGAAALIPPVNLCLLLWLAAAQWPRPMRRLTSVPRTFNRQPPVPKQKIQN